MNKCGKALAITLLSVATLALTSCKKEGNRLFKGDYSFKTSGSLVLKKTVTNPLEEGSDIESFISVNLPTESGQMNILPVGRKSDKAIVTMNIIGGDALVLDAEISGNVLTVEPSSRAITIQDGTQKIPMTISISGEATKYEDVVIFDLQYAGSGSPETVVGDITEFLINYQITRSDVKCLAKEND